MAATTRSPSLNLKRRWIGSPCPVEAGTSTLTQITERNFGNRAAYLTFQYNYGQQPRVRARPNTDQQPEASPGGDGQLR